MPDDPFACMGDYAELQSLDDHAEDIWQTGVEMSVAIVMGFAATDCSDTAV